MPLASPERLVPPPGPVDLRIPSGARPSEQTPDPGPRSVRPPGSPKRYFASVNGVSWSCPNQDSVQSSSMQMDAVTYPRGGRVLILPFLSGSLPPPARVFRRLLSPGRGRFLGLTVSLQPQSYPL